MTSDTWTRENLAWASGLLEGEGCWSFFKPTTRSGKKSSYTTFQLAVGSTDLDVLTKLKRIIGFGHMYGPYQKAKHKPMYHYKVSTPAQVYAISVAVLPFMGERRSKRIKDLVTEYSK